MQTEEESVAFLDHSDSEDEFDPSTLPDPDRSRNSDQEDDPETYRYVLLYYQDIKKNIIYCNVFLTVLCLQLPSRQNL